MAKYILADRNLTGIINMKNITKNIVDNAMLLPLQRLARWVEKFS
jgi:hypothetical protein